jgi:hypothetical protein
MLIIEDWQCRAGGTCFGQQGTTQVQARLASCARTLKHPNESSLLSITRWENWQLAKSISITALVSSVKKYFIKINIRGDFLNILANKVLKRD